MVKKLLPAKTKAARKRPAKAPAEKIQNAPSKSPLLSPAKWRLMGIAALALAILCGTHWPTSQSAPALPGGANAIVTPLHQWGPKLDLETAQKIEAQDGIMDMKVDSQGNVYTLSGAELRLYTAGKLSKSVTFDSGPNRSMAFDGSMLYVTNSDNNAVAKFDKTLTFKGSIRVPEAQRLLGISWLPHRSEIAVTDVDGKSLYFLDSSGEKIHQVSGPVARTMPSGFVNDLKTDSKGNLYESDQYGEKIYILGPDGKPSRIFPMQYGRENGRLAVLDGKIYSNFKNEGVILMTDMQGKPLGYIKKDTPQMLAAGQDGFLYLQSGGKIYKLKPLVSDTEALKK